MNSGIAGLEKQPTNGKRSSSAFSSIEFLLSYRGVLPTPSPLPAGVQFPIEERQKSVLVSYEIKWKL